MPLNHLRELLAAVQSTFDEPEVGANLAKVSERRREYLLWALADDLLRPMFDDYSLEPQSAKTYRIAVLQSSIRNIGTWPIFPEDPQALRQLAQITSLIETKVKRTHHGVERLPQWPDALKRIRMKLDNELEIQGCLTQRLTADQMETLLAEIETAEIPFPCTRWGVLTAVQQAEEATKGCVITQIDRLSEKVWGVWFHSRPAARRKQIDDLNARMTKPLEKLASAMSADLRKIHEQRKAAPKR